VDSSLTSGLFHAYKARTRAARNRGLNRFSGSDFGFPSDPSRTGIMANTSSAKKAVRKIARRTAINRSRRSKLRTFVRKVEDALAAGDSAVAAAALQQAAPIVMRAAQLGVIHKNTASRKVSRLTARVKALSVRTA
jgi:small subunit ribosomal protein S20